jgi:hypothetical protein
MIGEVEVLVDLGDGGELGAASCAIRTSAGRRCQRVVSGCRARARGRGRLRRRGPWRSHRLKVPGGGPMFAVRAVKDHQALFGKPPTSYAYDRAGASEKNVAALKELGVSTWDLAPRGRAKWQVGPDRAHHR